MSLDVNRLRDAIKTEIEGCFGPADDNAKLLCFCEAVATAVITEITTNAVVNTTVSGVQSGGATANGVGTVS